MTATHQRYPHDQWDIVSSVGLTALAVAAGRALETSRPDALIDDPFAKEFVAAAEDSSPLPLPTHLLGTAQPATPAADDDTMWEHVSHYMGVRSRFFDRFFQSAASDGIRQGVLLASGLDARAFRLHWPDDFRLFEIDQPNVLSFKLRVLDRQGVKPGCDHRTVAIDLRDNWMAALDRAGFDPTLPTAWLAEGLLPYLPADALHQLLATIDRLSAPGSRVSVEHIDDVHTLFDNEHTTRMSEQFGMDIRDLMPNDEGRIAPDQWLADHGWAIRQDPVTEIAANYGRPIENAPTHVTRNQRFITGVRPR